MLLAGDLVIVAMMALMVLLLVAGAEAMWRRRGRRAMTHAPRPTAGSDLMPAAIHPARRPSRRAAGVRGARAGTRPASAAPPCSRRGAGPQHDRRRLSHRAGDGGGRDGGGRAPGVLPPRTRPHARAPAPAALAGAGGAVSGVSDPVSAARDGPSPRSAPPRRPPEVTGGRWVGTPLSPGPLLILSGCR